MRNVGLMDFYQKTRHEGIALSRGEASQCIDIIPFGEIRDMPHHGQTEATQIDSAHSQIPEEVITRNIA